MIMTMFGTKNTNAAEPVKSTPIDSIATTVQQPQPQPQNNAATIEWSDIQATDSVAVASQQEIRARPNINFAENVDTQTRLLCKKWLNNHQKSSIVDYYCDAVEQISGIRLTNLTLDKDDIEAFWTMETLPRDVGLFKNTAYQHHRMTAENLQNIHSDEMATQIAENSKKYITPSYVQEGFCFHAVKGA